MQRFCEPLELSRGDMAGSTRFNAGPRRFPFPVRRALALPYRKINQSENACLFIKHFIVICFNEIPERPSLHDPHRACVRKT